MKEILNTIINDNAINGLKTIEDNSIDLIVTSPPYDNLRLYKNKTENELKKNWNFEVFKKIADELTRVLKPGGVIVWIVGDATIKGSETGTSFKQALYFKENCKLNIFDTMIYMKNGISFPSKNKYHQIFEYMFIFSKGKPKTFNPIEDRYNKYFNIKSYGKNSQRNKNGILNIISEKKRIISKNYFGKRFNIWKINGGAFISTRDKIAFKHPAIFPDKLALDHIYSWSNEGDIVLDPFAGSGTTLKMAKILKRNYIGIEINQKYIPIIEERIKLADEIINDSKKYYNLTKHLNPTKEELIKTLKEEIKIRENLLEKLKKDN